MSFSVGSFDSQDVSISYGQGITPNVPGPNGSGTCPTSGTVSVQSVIIGFLTGDTSDRADTCYIYSIELDDPSEIGQSTGLVATSTGSTDSSGTTVFGNNTYIRTYSFSSNSLSPSTQYYVYYSAPQEVAYWDAGIYSGGNFYDDWLDSYSNMTSQFQVTFN